MPLTVERLRKARQIEYAIDKFLKAIDHKGKVMTMNNKLAETSYRYFLPFVDAYMKFTIDEINKAFAKQYINKSFGSFEKDKAVDITTNLLDWRDLDNTGAKMLKPATLEIMANSGNLANKIAGVEGVFDIINPKTVEMVNGICSKLITQVNGETRNAINEIIRQGLLDGKSMGKIAKEIKPLVGLTSKQAAAVGKYEAFLGVKRPDLSTDKINRLVEKYTNKLHNYRTDMIARTESMRAVNEGQRLAYVEEGYKTLIWSANAGACPQCAAENGHDYSIEEAEGMIPLHPDCRCTWLTGSRKAKPEEIPEGAGPGLDPLGMSNANFEQLRAEAKLNGMMFDQANNLESAAMTKQRICKELAEKLKDNKTFIDYVKSNFPHPEYWDTELLNNRVKEEISNLIRQWAGTSGDESARAIAMQMATRSEFGLTNATLQHFRGSALREAEALFAKNGKAFQAFLRAQYDLTQEYFAKNGITNLTGFRGMKFTEKVKGFVFGDKYSITARNFELQSLSSFSTDFNAAKAFAQTGDYRMMLQSKIPVNRILSTCQTGFGCKSEAEFVILGGQDFFKIASYGNKMIDQNLLQLFADFKVPK